MLICAAAVFGFPMGPRKSCFSATTIGSGLAARRTSSWRCSGNGPHCRVNGRPGPCVTAEVGNLDEKPCRRIKSALVRAFSVNISLSLPEPLCWPAPTTLCAGTDYATRLDKPDNRIETHTLPIMSRPLLGQALQRRSKTASALIVPDPCQFEDLEDL